MGWGHTPRIRAAIREQPVAARDRQQLRHLAHPRRVHRIRVIPTQVRPVHRIQDIHTSIKCEAEATDWRTKRLSVKSMESLVRDLFTKQSEAAALQMPSWPRRQLARQRASGPLRN